MLENLDDRAWLKPPDYEAYTVLKCCCCERGIFQDAEYYEIEFKAYCKDCLDDNFKKYAEKQELWED